MALEPERIKMLGMYYKNREKHICVYGVGNLGARIADILVKLGFNITIIDYQKVEEVNIGYQLYSKLDIGSFKTTALKRRLEIDHPWSNIQDINMYIAGLGGFLLSDEDIEKQNLLLKKLFNDSDCAVVTFDRVGPRLTILAYALIYEKPIVWASTWTSFSANGNTTYHEGRVNIWKPGLPCPMCYTKINLSVGNRVYTAHPLISNITASLSAYMVERLLNEKSIVPYIVIRTDETTGKTVIEYISGTPSYNCPFCRSTNELKRVLNKNGLFGLLKMLEVII